MAELVVWTEPLAGSNCYLFAEEGACLVIDPNDPKGPSALLAERGWTPELIFLTHEHCDHMAGLEALRARFPAAGVIASAACSAGIQDRRLNMSRMMEVYLTFHGKPGVSYPPFACRPADITYGGEWTALWRGHSLRCVPLPGHTPGSAGIFWDETTLFSGDYLIPGEAALLRLPGGSEADYEARTQPVLSRLRPGLRICPGHGVPYTLTRKDLRDHGL